MGSDLTVNRDLFRELFLCSFTVTENFLSCNKTKQRENDLDGGKTHTPTNNKPDGAEPFWVFQNVQTVKKRYARRLHRKIATVARWKMTHDPVIQRKHSLVLCKMFYSRVGRQGLDV